MVEFQSLTLVNGQYSDAIKAITLNGFVMQCLVPLLQKVVQSSDVVSQILIQQVIKLTDVRALILECVELKDGKQTFNQINGR